MSHEYYILNLLNIKDKNVKLLDNFYIILIVMVWLKETIISLKLLKE